MKSLQATDEFKTAQQLIVTCDNVVSLTALSLPVHFVSKLHYIKLYSGAVKLSGALWTAGMRGSSTYENVYVGEIVSRNNKIVRIILRC